MRRAIGTRRAAELLVVGATVAGGLLGGGGCLQILGDDRTFVLGGAGAGGGTTTSGGTGGVGGTGGTTTTTECEPGTSEACYDGPEGTEDVGVCAGGTHECGPDGMWGTCDGEVTPTAETCVTKTDEDCDGRECALWSWIASSSTGAIPVSTQADSKGNLVVLGLFGGTLTIGNDALNEADGGPIFLAKFSTSGEPLWAKNFGGVDSKGTFAADSLEIDSNDNIYVGLNFTDSFSTGNISYTADGDDFCVTKLTPAGTVAWSQHYGGAMEQRLWDISVDKGGVVRAVGIYTGAISVGGTFGSGNGLFVARLSASSGLADSAQTFDSPQYGEPRTEVGPDDSWVLTARCPTSATVAGKLLDPCDNFVAKFDKSDILQWAVSVASKPNDVVVTSSGDALVTADFQNTLDFGGTPLSSMGSYDVLVAKLKSSDGSVEWARSWGGAGDDEYAQLSIGGQDRFYLSLNVSDTIDFGGGPLGGAGLSDALVAALDATGNHRFSRAFGDATSQSGLIAARADGAGLFVTVGLTGDIDFGAGILHSDAGTFAVAELAP